MSAYNIGWIWDQNVSPTQKLVLFALNEHTNMSHGDWRIWPSVKNIMRLTGLSERAIRSAVAELSEMGLITVCAQHDPNTGRQLSNIYYLTAPFPGGEGANAAGGRVQMLQGEGANAAPLEPSYKNPSPLPIGKERVRFAPPSINEVEAFISERGLNVDAGKFFHHYEAVGWKVGKNPMKKWQSALHKWHSSGSNNNGNSQANRPGSNPREDRSAAGRIAANAQREREALGVSHPDDSPVGADGPYVWAQVVECVRG